MNEETVPCIHSIQAGRGFVPSTVMPPPGVKESFVSLPEGS